MTSQARTKNEDGEVLLKEFLLDADLQGLTDETRRTYKSNIEGAFKFFDGDPHSIDRHDLKDLLYHLKNERPGQDGTPGVSPSTINNWFSALNSYFKFLDFEGYIQDNLLPGFRESYLDFSRDGTGSERQLISVQEMSMLVHGTLNVRNRAIILTLAKTGVRRKGLVQIDLDHVDWEEQYEQY